MSANCSQALRTLAGLFLIVYALPAALNAEDLSRGKLAARQTAMPADLKAAFETARYGIQRDPKGGQRAENDANHFAIKFAGAKTIIEAGKGADATLTLAGYGWGLTLRSAGAVTQEDTAGKRLERHYGSGLSEWFENTPQGLEQGFVVRQREEGARGALRIRLADGGRLGRAHGG